MKRKTGLILVAALVLGLLGGCSLFMGEEGDAYQGYAWYESLDFFYDENPATPSTVYNGEYFPTSEGQFYMEYSTVNDSGWWAIYTIEREAGTLFTDGDTSWLDIYLYSSGPEFYRYKSSNSIAGDTPTVEQSQITSREISGLQRRPAIGSQERREGGYIYRLEYGRLE